MPEPSPGRREVVVQVMACGVCRTDLQLCEGDLEAHVLPIVPGHQVVGRVVGLGADADRHRLGDRVGITWLAGTCGRCRFCRTDRENLCEGATFTGWDRHGGYAELMCAREDHVHALPEGPGDTDLAPLLCAGVIGYRSLRVSGIRPGQRLGLFGFGSSASIVIQVAVHMGCEVFVCTRSESERAVATELGATWTGHFDERPPHLLDAAVTTAPVGDSIVHALSALDRGGVVAVNAIHLDRVPEFPYELLWLERQIRSVANVTRSDVQNFLVLAAAIPIVTRHEDHSLDEVSDTLVALSQGRLGGSAVVIP